MTGDAERHQIVLIICAAIGERSDVMHKCWANVSLTLFAHLTERMPRQMSVTDTSPHAAIPLMLIVLTREILVVSLHDFLVCLTVTAFPVCKFRTACHSTRALWFSRHCVSPSKKPSRRITSPRRLNQFSIFTEYIISLVRQWHQDDIDCHLVTFSDIGEFWFYSRSSGNGIIDYGDEKWSRILTRC